MSLLAIFFSGGVEATPETVPFIVERVGSAVARLHEFLGLVLPWLGIFAVGYTLRHTASPPLRLLVSAWALSCVMAFGLRFVVLELMKYQKELYWTGALIAIVSGFLITRAASKARWGNTLAGVLLAGIIAAGIFRFLEMAPRFYGEYLFLN
jgi:hypothetical protein